MMVSLMNEGGARCCFGLGRNGDEVYFSIPLLQVFG